MSDIFHLGLMDHANFSPLPSTPCTACVEVEKQSLKHALVLISGTYEYIPLYGMGELG